MTDTYDKKKVRIAIGGKNLGRVDNGTITWRKLCGRLSEVTVTPEKFVEYQRGKPQWKNNLKNCAGYWIGGHCADGHRTKKGMTVRDVLCFDIDNGDLYEGDLLKDLRDGNTGISDYEFFVHSSRSHTFVKPRIRVVFLLKEPIKADDYAPLARFMAQKLDATMHAVDPVSFRVAQMMYMPSCSSDVKDQFVSFRNKGTAVDPYQFLEECSEEWRDYETWPRAPGEGDMRPPVDKAEWPMSKKGIVGAFCRVYDIHSAIEEFIPHIYDDLDESGINPRYRLADGSGGHGAVVHDDGVFIYSYHGTDAASETNLNAFDMVRMHLFGKLDDKLEAKGELPSMRKRPSFKAMEDLVADNPEVQKELIADFVSYEALNTDLDEVDEVDTSSEFEAEMSDLLGGSTIKDLVEPDAVSSFLKPEVDKGEWLKDLEVTPTGLKPTIYNAAVIIANDSRTKGCFAFNELTNDVTLVRPLKKPSKHLYAMPLVNKTDGDMVGDHHIDLVRAFIDSPGKPIGSGYGLKLGMGDTGSALGLVARGNSYHPIRRFLKKQQWDGKPRVESFFVDYLASPDNIYTREASRLMFLGAVTRVFEPGHKFDTAIILESEQGTGKSTLISILGMRRWSSELSSEDFGNQQKMVESMQGNWLIELPELKGVGKADANTLKAFISGQKEEVRMAYARTVQPFYRQCIFIGSTNDTQYLIDTTGNRRFLPIVVNKTKYDMIDLDGFEAEVEQFWAEAYQMYLDLRKNHPHGTLPLTLSPEAEAIADGVQESRVREGVEHPLAGTIEHQADRPVLRSTLGNVAQSLDLDAEDDPMVVRNVLSLQSIHAELLGGAGQQIDSRGVANITRAMSLLEGWVRGPRIRSQYLPEGRATVWYRKSSFPTADLVEKETVTNWLRDEGFYTEVADDTEF